MREHIGTLQEQVNELYVQLNELRSRQDGAMVSSDPGYNEVPVRSMSMSMSRTLPPLMPPDKPPQRVMPKFHGPTSSTYGFDVARSSLQTMGITSNNNLDDGIMSRERSRAASPFSLVAMPHPSKDPLWLIDHGEAMRLCGVYEEEIGIMYPVLDVDKVVKHLSMLYQFIGAALRTGLAQPSLHGADALDDEESTMAKMVLAITLVIEGNGRSELGQRLFDSAKTAIDLKVVGPVDLRSVIFIVLTVSQSPFV